VCEDHSPTDNHEQTNLTPKATRQMRLNLTNVARECDLHGVSDRCAASIVSAVLQYVGIVTELDVSMAVDKNNISRERLRENV